MSRYIDTSKDAGKLLDRMKDGGHAPNPRYEDARDLHELIRKGYVERDYGGNWVVSETGRKANDDGAAGW